MHWTIIGGGIQGTAIAQKTIIKRINNRPINNH